MRKLLLSCYALMSIAKYVCAKEIGKFACFYFAYLSTCLGYAVSVSPDLLPAVTRFVFLWNFGCARARLKSPRECYRIFVVVLCCAKFDALF